MKLPEALEKEPVMSWREESRVLTLTGEPVLEMRLSWPEWTGTGALARHAGRYYARLARRWREHWAREGYLSACLALVERREQSRPFLPWSVSLGGRVTLDGGEYLSLSLLARERREDGRTLEYRWGDVWRKADGAAMGLGELLSGERRWRRQLRQALERAAQEGRQGGLCLDQALEKPLRRWFSPRRAALTEEGLEVYYPQCTLAPAAEGAPALRLSLPQSARWAVREEVSS